MSSFAARLSVIPGAGQIYAGRVGNGIARMTLALGLAAAAVLPIVFMAGIKAAASGTREDDGIRSRKSTIG
jgi:TM2 domain-containing membrane protein YozV